MGLKKGMCIIGKKFKTYDAAEDARRIFFHGMKNTHVGLGIHPHEPGWVIYTWGKPGRTKWHELPKRCGEYWGWIRD